MRQWLVSDPWHILVVCYYFNLVHDAYTFRAQERTAGEQLVTALFGPPIYMAALLAALCTAWCGNRA